MKVVSDGELVSYTKDYFSTEVSRKGFTIIEVLIIIGIIGIVSSLIIPNLIRIKTGTLIENEVEVNEVEYEERNLTPTHVNQNNQTSNNIVCLEGKLCIYINGHPTFLCTMDEWGDYQPIPYGEKDNSSDKSN